MNEEGARRLHHKTLSAYYPHLFNLRDLITSLLPPSTVIALSNDPEGYHKLLSDTICAFQTPPGLRKVYTVACQGTQQDAVARIARALEGRGKNVLSFRERYVETPVNLAGGWGSLSTAAFLRSFPWRILRSRIGDELIRTIVVEGSLFSKADNNCYIQLSGCPINDLPELATSTYQVPGKRKRAAKLKGGRSMTRGSPPKSMALGKRPSRTVADTESPAERLIARHAVFYGQPLRSKNGKIKYGLHPKHALNEALALYSAGSEDAAGLMLARTIFPSSGRTLVRLGKDSAESSGKAARRSQILGAMKELLDRHRKINLVGLIKRYVALGRDHTNEGLQAVPHSLVGRCLSGILRQLLSSSTVASEHNIKVMVQHARHLVEAKQFEPLNLHTIMQQLRIDDFAWLKIPSNGRPNPDEAIKRRHLAEDLVFWLFNSYLVPLVKSSFYVTETAETRYQTVYYDHEEWARATRPHFEHLQETLLEPLGADERRIAVQSPLGVSAVRLIPKPNGFRPIVNLGRRLGTGNTTSWGKRKSANDLLTDIHHILSLEKDRNRGSLGSSLMGTSEIFAPLSALKVELKKKHGMLPRLYFVKMDIRAAFDTIKQDRMLEIIADLLDKDHEYCLIMYSLLLPPASKASSRMSRKLYKIRAALDDGTASFDNVAEDIAKPLRNAVMVDLVRRRRVTRDTCMELLKLHLQNNVWEIGSQLFRQREGIPQGSKISSLLCSFCYAALERQYLGFVHRSGSRLLRYIDDFLFISDDANLARRFMRTMSKGFHEYGAFVSPGKTLVNFEHVNGTAVAPVCSVNASGRSYFPYCGFLIDTHTLELSMEHTRILAGPIEQSFSLRFCRKRGASFVGWLSRQLENRNHIAYLDSLQNTAQTVWLNVYLNFAMAAMKIPHYFKDDLSPRQARVIVEAICQAVEYTYIAGRARIQHTARAELAKHYAVKKLEFTYLAKSAVLSALSRKASRFKDVVHLLELNLGRREYRKLQTKFGDVFDRAAIVLRDANY